MTRHGKNNTASACYSYYERQLDAKKSGYGTQRERLNKDSIKDFDACSLSLQTCRNPVITPSGVIYDKEAILEYIVHKKVDNVRKIKEYEKQLKSEAKEENDKAELEFKLKVKNFSESEKGLVVYDKSKQNEPSTSSKKEDKVNKMTSFWTPENTPDNKKTKLKKPDTNIYCPTTGEILKAKDLIPINFTLINPNEKNLISKKDRYKCPVTHDVLSNSIPCAVLKTSGSVVTMECVEKILKKEMIDPINGKPMKDSDIILVQRGGTGYAETNDLVAKIKKPVMQA